ncbi:MAG TPA: hypothetical protein PKN36_10960 [bacterium]|jgi:hypothetical protein|nr:hypothetical protein [bacterium]
MPFSLQCIHCKHCQGFGECSAFPDEIPEEIFDGRFDHRKPYPGDKGIRWEKAEHLKGNGRKDIGVEEE